MSTLRLPLNAQIPVTPPPEHHTFPKSQAPLSPQPLKTFTQEVYGSMGTKIEVQTMTSAPEVDKTEAAAAGTQTRTHNHIMDTAGAALDPRYLAMVSRIATYYQQRCQALANYQQHRCQAWANMHRQKCQEMMQAAMLVVAWYIRDRIQRRRRRQKRQFRKGLSNKCSRNKVTKGETVRRWVMDVPESALSPNNPVRDKWADAEEAEFDVDKETTPDKDMKLFTVADNLIKSQLARVDVPLMGALSFDESASESEEDEAEEDDDDEDEEEMEGDSRGQGEEGDDEDLYEDDDVDEEMEEYEEDAGSEAVQPGTGKGSRKRTRSTFS